MTEKKPPRVACIGTGYWGRNLVRNFAELGALHGVCDADAARLEEFAGNYPDTTAYRTPADVVADAAIDAVAIATPAETHGRLVRLALEAGKDVFVEKPLALSAKEGRQLADLARARGRILMVGHLLWYHPAIRRLKQLIESGELGRIRYVYSNRLNLGKIRREENILWSFAPHDISVLLGLLGEMPDRVEAMGGNYLHDRIADVTVSTLSFPSGVRAHVFVSWLHPFKEQKLVVVGDRQMAVFDDVSPDQKLVLYPHRIDWQGQIPVANKAEGTVVALEKAEPLREECSHFLDCVATRARPRTDAEEAIRVLTVLEACQRALEAPGDGRHVRPPQPADVPSASEKHYKAHESAYIDDDVEIGAGTTIWHFTHVLRGSAIGEKCRIGQNVVIGPAVRIGDNVKIQNNVSVYEGVTLEDNVFCGPSMVFTNVLNPRSEVPRMSELMQTLVRTGATLGANCTIVCGTTIGRYAFVGAGAVVTKDVPDHALVVGNPARQIGWMCACGVRLDVDGQTRIACTSCGRLFEKNAEAIVMR